MTILQLSLLAVLLLSACALKMQPPPTISQTNFASHTGVTLEVFLQNGSAKHVPWFLLFKIPACKHCQQAEMLFQSFFIQYNKRLHFEPEVAKDLFETNFQFAFIDCEESPNICGQFGIDQYPTYFVVEGNGEVCKYVGDRMPFSMISFLEERQRGEGSEKCLPLGKVTLLTRWLAYLQPLLDLMNYNTALFILAFVVGPFLFGFVFSRNKKQRVDQAEALQQEKKD